MSPMNKRRAAVYGVAACLVVAAGVLLGMLATQLRRPVISQIPSDASDAASGQADDMGFGSTVLYNGQEYRYNTNLETVLFLGIDQSDTVTAQDVLGKQGRSDTMILFILDPVSQQTQMLEISRDTMMDVDIYDEAGNVVISDRMQLTLQYAFGTSRTRSNWLTENKISDLLYGIPINNVLSFTMDGIAPVVDALGGISITIPADYTAIDPAFIQGETLTLTGAQAERYVRYRDTTVSGSNDTRMERQQQFSQALYRQLFQGDTATAMAVYQNTAAQYIETDLNADSLQRMAQYALQTPAYKVPGETRAGQFHDEYYVDEDALRQLLIALFYQPVS